MNLLAAALLGVVQGVTEFLPISSSAHLILVRAFFGWDAEGLGLAFDVACHVGTLAAVVVYFRTDLGAMVRAIPAAFSPFPDPDARRLRLIAAGTVPIVIVGLLWADWLESHTRTPLVAAVALLIGAGLLLFIERVRTAGRGEEALSLSGAFVVGIAQASALIPGVSRSGATIATGMAMGLRREAAARFTFLMSIPAIIAAAAKEALALGDLAMGPAEWRLFAVGMGTSAIVGYFTVKYLLRFLATHRLDVFAWYRVGLSAVTFAWLAGR